MNKRIKPFRSVSPGEIIVRMMDSMGWSQSDLAEITDLSDKTISYLINNKQIITAETAGLLGEAFGKTPNFWINLSANYQLSKKDSDTISKEELAKVKAQMHKYMPVSEMKKKGWFVNDVSTIYGIENEYERIFGQRVFPVEYFEKESHEMIARQTRDDTEYTKYYRTSWFSFAKFHAKNIVFSSKSNNNTKYKASDLREIANSLYKYTMLQNGVEKILSDLNSAGVNFFVLSHLSKTYLDGAAFIEGDKPFIVYTGRYDREDNFWFVIAHEIAHILYHYDFLQQPFLDDMEDSKLYNQNTREKEADEKAGAFLNQNAVLSFGREINCYVTEDRLNRISKLSKVSVPVALGMLQYAGKVSWKQFSKYKPKIIERIPNEYIKG